MKKKLTTEEILSLQAEHGKEKRGKVRDRIKAIIPKDAGWSEEMIAKALLIHLDTVKRHLKDYNCCQHKLKAANSGS